MIRSVEIQKLRGIREGKLDDLTPLVVLVGPNGSGKSSVLDAILIGASEDIAEAFYKSVQRSVGLRRSPRWVLWKAGEGGRSRMTLVTTTGQARTCTCGLAPGGPSVGPLAQFGCEIEPSAAEKQHRTVGLFGVSVNGPSNSFRWAPLEDAPSARIITAHSVDTDTPLYQLYSQAVEQGRRKAATALIADLVPGVSSVEILTEGNTPVVHLVFEDHSVPVELAGDGICALLRLSLELASRPGGVVLVEEPELHLHPGAIRQSAKAIFAAVRRRIQVILATHSLEFIDALLAEASDEDLELLSLYRTQLEDGVLSSHRLPGSDVNRKRTEIQDDLR